MSINVYLQGDKVKELEGFRTEHGQEQGRSWEQYSLPGIKVFYDNGRWHIALREPTKSIPLAVADIVEEISFREWIPFQPHREAGIYHYESAEAEVKPDMAGDKHLNKIDITAKKMEDVLKLFRMIRTGSIRPEESYEQQQTGQSRTELEEELQQAKDDIRRTTEAHRDARDRLHEIDAYASCLIGQVWPFCRKRTVAIEISKRGAKVD